jgi:hypothetical protein
MPWYHQCWRACPVCHLLPLLHCSGSDSGSYDHQGRFVPQAFEEMLSKYDKDNKGGLYYMVRLRADLTCGHSAGRARMLVVLLPYQCNTATARRQLCVQHTAGAK